MSIVDSILEKARSEHPCRLCDHHEGDWCKWSDRGVGAVPVHMTWHSIDWDEPRNYADCPTNTFDSTELEG
ncbi:hypothetical protein A6A40_17195 (plasmid) [Azospirillum humicireducens]|uniref:Uncharacterized protein n=1 Tax=Azospirillum humicireducens TaxID=1226968 RepID=A0A2R4VQT6_9PROT|nr:hypothetical protein [Azospirillum humicireducens]AWB06790.1 hypothetical protein A6A40_17195 [Azospirillum humicireducens]